MSPENQSFLLQRLREAGLTPDDKTKEQRLAELIKAILIIECLSVSTADVYNSLIRSLSEIKLTSN